MKNFKALLLCSLFVLGLAACSKKDEPSLTSGSMSATVDGKAWSAGLAVQATKSNGVLGIGGTGNGGQININLINYTKPGKFELGGSATNGNHATYTNVAIPPVFYTNLMGQGSGTLEITSESGGFIEGTFSFTAKKSPGGGSEIKVTEGKFKAKLQ